MDSNLVSEPVRERLKHLDLAYIRRRFAPVLDKLAQGLPLTEDDLELEALPIEVAAIWSLTNNEDIRRGAVREIKRQGRVTPVEETGRGKGMMSYYKVRDILGVRVGHQRGRRWPKSKEEERGDG